MERTDAAELLGVSTHASADAVREAFRERVRANHPDRRAEGAVLVDLRELAEARDELLSRPDDAPPKLAPSSTVESNDDAGSPASAKLRAYRREGTPTSARTRPGARSTSSRSGTGAAESGVAAADRRSSVLSLLAIAAVITVLVFGFIFVRGLVFSSPECVVEVDGEPALGACVADSQWQVVTVHDTDAARCEFPTERMTVASGLWCITPHTP